MAYNKKIRVLKMTTSDMMREFCEKNEYQYFGACSEDWAVALEF